MEDFHLFKLFIQLKMLHKSKTLDWYEADREVSCLYMSLWLYIQKSWKSGWSFNIICTDVKNTI